MMVQPERHGRGLPIHNHADQSKERDRTQFRHSKLSERAAVLRRQIGQIVRELVQPIDAGTGAWKCLCQQQCGSHNSLSLAFSVRVKGYRSSRSYLRELQPNYAASSPLQPASEVSRFLAE